MTLEQLKSAEVNCLKKYRFDEEFCNMIQAKAIEVGVKDLDLNGKIYSLAVVQNTHPSSTPYYVTLGFSSQQIADGINSADLKRAYRAACIAKHPDRGGTNEEFQEVHEAFALRNTIHLTYKLV